MEIVRFGLNARNILALEARSIGQRACIASPDFSQALLLALRRVALDAPWPIRTAQDVSRLRLS